MAGDLAHEVGEHLQVVCAAVTCLPVAAGDLAPQVCHLLAPNCLAIIVLGVAAQDAEVPAGPDARVMVAQVAPSLLWQNIKFGHQRVNVKVGADRTDVDAPVLEEKAYPGCYGDATMDRIETALPAGASDSRL